MTYLNLSAGVILLAALAGCVSLPAPAYQHQAGQPGAKLNLMGRDKNWICVDRERHRLAADADGYADIPAGARLTFLTNYADRRGSCNYDVSFVPAAGQRYQTVIDVGDNKCFMTVMKEDASAPLGVSLERSSGRAASTCN
jgi:hypothetical protein